MIMWSLRVTSASCFMKSDRLLQVVGHLGFVMSPSLADFCLLSPDPVFCFSSLSFPLSLLGSSSRNPELVPPRLRGFTWAFWIQETPFQVHTITIQNHTHQYHTVMRHLDTDLEAKREWNEVIVRIKAGESPQSVAESKALDFIVLEESRLPKTRHFGKARN